MKKCMTAFTCLVLALASLFLVSCGGTAAVEKKLCSSAWEFVWEGIQTETYTFKDDGTYTLEIDSSLVGSVSQSGTYTVDEDSVNLVRDSDSYESSLTYTYESGSLTLTCRNKSLTK